MRDQNIWMRGSSPGTTVSRGTPTRTSHIAAFEAHGLGSGSAVADLGAGTGQFAIPAARRFGRVIAVDVSSAMLAALRAKADRDGLDNLTVERAGFLGFSPGSPVDGVFTRNALHQLPDFAEHIRTEYSTFRWLLEPMLAAAGFEITDVSYERRLYGAYTCVKVG